MMRLPEPVRQHAVFGHPVHDRIRSHDRRVHTAAEDQEPDQHDERLEQEPRQFRSDQVHCEAGDQVVVEARPDGVGNQRDRQEADRRREDQAVEENDPRRAPQVQRLGVFDLAVHLSECFQPAHREERMTEADDHRDHRDRGEHGALEPSERFR